MAKKKPEDSHKVLDDKEKRARKEHESASNVEGISATGEAGNERDRVANLTPIVRAVKIVEELLAEAIEAISEEVPETIEIPITEPTGELEEVSTTTGGEVAEGIPEDELAKIGLDDLQREGQEALVEHGKSVIEEAQDDTAVDDGGYVEAGTHLTEAEKEIALLKLQLAQLEQDAAKKTLEAEE